MIRSTRVLFQIALFLIASAQLQAQVQTGTPPFGSFGGGPDVIDLANLNVQLTIPVLNKSGRGRPFTYNIVNNSSVWYPVGASGSQTWQPVANWGWAGETDPTFGYLTYSISTSTCYSILHGTRIPTGTTSFESNFAYHDFFGTNHGFAGTVELQTGTCGTIQGSLTATATDGSGLVLKIPAASSATITTPSGYVITPAYNANTGTATATDRNGNQLSAASSGVFTDTLGTTALTVAGSGTTASPRTFTYTAPSGAAASYTMNFTNYTVATNFGVPGISEYKSTAAVPLVSSITLPDSSKYTFAYETTPSVPSSGACTPYAGTTCTTARLTSITLPTGGTISYSYTGGSNGIFSDGSTAGLKRYTPDTGSSAFWNYSRTQETGAASITTVTDPTAQANQTIVQFQGLHETQRDIYQGSAPTISTFPIPESTLQTSSLLKETQICYNANTANCTSTAIVQPITQRNITTLISGASSWANAQTAEHIYKYNTTGSLIEQDDYDYGTGAVGALLKKTSVSYASLTNIAAFRQQVTVTNGSGATVSQTNYNYGDTVTATSGTPQHTTPAGSRGNLLSVNYYTQGSTYLTKSYTYFDTGNVQTITDVNNAQTTYAYGACGNSFPTSVSEPLSLSRSMTWNCTGGVQTSVTDENGQVSSTTYAADTAFWRPDYTTDQLGNETSFYYAPNSTYPNVNDFAWFLTFNNGNSQASDIKYSDGLGRVFVEQRKQSPNASTLDSVSYTYDSSGRHYSTSVPCAIGYSATCSTPKTITTYDALNRVAQVTDGGGGTITNTYPQNDVLVLRGPAPTGENSKQHQSEYDALGRLASVCEMTSVPGSGTCGQNTPRTGFWTKYSYDPLGRLTGVTQNAQVSTGTQSRSYIYDLMGRMTSETNPESGTTTYVYDTDSTCGTYKGDLVKRTDAVGNVTCYSYDALHRKLSVTYPSGSYASKTPNKYFVYDLATVNSVSMVNGKTRLVEAYTSLSQAGTKITDLGISYTVRGEPSDGYESTPNSGGYYHVGETYWANGALNTLIGPSPLPTFTFTPDGEGRISAVSASTGQNPVTGVSYNSASLPTTLTYGSLDGDSFGYDPNTNRMTSYQFNVNSQSLTAILTWNANSTLQTIGITDALNTADTQTCNYLHDDLIRLASANCGSAWSQTFSYDAFGNIAKSGSATFAASYNPATNQISSVGGFTPTYDANGNTLTDPAHTYSWDSAGKPVTIDTVNVTYDALGRMVEQNRSGVYTQFVYGPHGGKLAIMSGQTLQKAIIPLVGGAQAVYNASGLLYYGHSDHLGSIRLGSTPTRTMSFDIAYAPFGETYASSGSADPAFTGQRQDTVTGLFDFPAREYSNEGRWSSPDPSGISAFHLTDPQSINRYVYARNTPLSVIDPTGLVTIPGGYDDGEDGGGGVWFGGLGGTSLDPWEAYPCICSGPGDPTFGGSASNSGGDIPSGTDCSANPTVCSVTVNMLTYQDNSLDGTILGQIRNDPGSMAILNSASDWIDAGTSYTGIVFGTIVAGPAMYDGIATLGQAAEANLPGIYDASIDVMNVLSPIPSVGATMAGLYLNVDSIGDQVINGRQTIIDDAYTGWQWFNSDSDVNAPYKP